MTRLALLGGTLALCLFVGAGCTPATSPTTTDDADTSKVTSSDQRPGTVTSRDLTLSANVAEATVNLTWTLEEGLENPEKFIIVRSDEPQPMHDGKTDWYRHPGHRREATWEDVPAGTHHFRICTSDDGNTCGVYSNDVMVEVSSDSTATVELDLR